MNKGVRCTECRHFTEKGYYCQISSRPGRVYQNASPRTCAEYQPDRLKVLHPEEWEVETRSSGTIWQVAVKDRKPIQFYTIKFPRSVSYLQAHDEAVRHWQAFALRAVGVG